MAALAGDAWKPEYETAWALAFDVVAGAMIEGAQEAELAAVACRPEQIAGRRA